MRPIASTGESQKTGFGKGRECSATSQMGLDVFVRAVRHAKLGCKYCKAKARKICKTLPENLDKLD